MTYLIFISLKFLWKGWSAQILLPQKITFKSNYPSWLKHELIYAQNCNLMPNFWS
jgi:hypothetical protein